MQTLVSLDDLADGDIETILEDASAYHADPRGHRGRFPDRIVCSAFFEPSTRTRLSFEAAAQRLGAQVIGFSDAAATSTSKGERLEDTVRVVSALSDAVVLRHPEEGAARRAAAVVDVPVVNAGDGVGEHPTQTLVDLFTLRQALGGLEGRRVAIVGDLLYGRTVHSLVPALRRFGIDVVQVPGGHLELPAASGHVPKVGLEEAAADSDALYVTRVQRERFRDPKEWEAVRGQVRVDRALLERTGSEAVVLHPLPRVDELADDVDALPAAKYFDQVRNGLPVRMAVLANLLEARG